MSGPADHRPLDLPGRLGAHQRLSRRGAPPQVAPPQVAPPQRSSVWRWPVVIAVSTALGLGLALAGPGLPRVLSWIGLTLPLVITGYFVRKSKPKLKG